jgi:hypothetical protein
MKFAFTYFRKLTNRLKAVSISIYVAIVLEAIAIVALVFFVGILDRNEFIIQICALFTALLAFLGWRRFPLSRAALATLAVVLAVVSVIAFWAQTSARSKNVGNDKQMNPWGVYHYYMGVKYFDELGYTGLYEQTLAADADGKRRLAKVNKIRNLTNYKLEKIDFANYFKRSDAFSDARWREFKSDVNYFTKGRGIEFWKHVLRDRGYNASPAWNAFASLLIKLFSIQKPASQTFLIFVDVFLVLLAFGLSVRAYGWTRSLLVLSAFYLWFGNSMHLFGQIYILDWFAACWAGISAWRLGWARTSGIFLAYATMVRVFPAALFLGPLLYAGVKLIRLRRLDLPYRRFFLSAFLCAVVLFALGGAHTRQGFGAWKMFASNTIEHREHHIEGMRRLGLEHIFTLDFSSGWRENMSRKHIRENIEKNKPVFRVIQILMLALLLLALRRADEHDALLLGAALVFIGTIASRYYGSIFLFLLFLGIGTKGVCSPEHPPGRAAGRNFVSLMIDCSLFVLIFAVWAAQVPGANSYGQYVFANMLLLVWFAALLAVRAFARRKKPPSAPSDSIS